MSPMALYGYNVYNHSTRIFRVDSHDLKDRQYLYHLVKEIDKGVTLIDEQGRQIDRYMLEQYYNTINEQPYYPSYYQTVQAPVGETLNAPTKAETEKKAKFKNLIAYYYHRNK